LQRPPKKWPTGANVEDAWDNVEFATKKPEKAQTRHILLFNPHIHHGMALVQTMKLQEET
jgi:hypothetical protein